jgi:tRNA dimethylallyltransferase
MALCQFFQRMKALNPKTLLVVSGPTASGKTALAIRLAQHFGTEIISADSRQFYKELPVGTAAPSLDEQTLIKHHFVGNLSVSDSLDVASYETEVLALLQQLFEIHDLVILCGGSGLFIDAVCEGLDAIPDTEDEIRKEVEKIYLEEGLSGLQKRIQEIDPEYFAIADTQNPRRLQRALEVWMQTGETFTSFRKNEPVKRDFQIIRIAIQNDRKELIEKINQRTDQMIVSGLIDEARNMLSFRHLNSLNTVGYKELFDYFDGKCTLDEAVEKIRINTRRYAKRQMTWLRKNPNWHWFKTDETDKIIQFVMESKH